MTPLFDRLVVATLPLVPRALVERVASRYVAGETLDDALATVRGARRRGRDGHARRPRRERDPPRADGGDARRVPRASSTRSPRAASPRTSRSSRRRSASRSTRRSPSRTARTSAARAAEHGMFVRLDMEDSPYTESTLRLALELKAEFPTVGVVIQAYLQRSLRDLDRLIAARMNVRICKGIYVEPRAIAWKDRATVIDNFARARRQAPLRRLLRRHRDARRGLRPARARDDRPAQARTGPLRVPDAPRGRPGAPEDPPRRRAPAAGLRARTGGTGTPTRRGASRRTPRSPGTSSARPWASDRPPEVCELSKAG